MLPVDVLTLILKRTTQQHRFSSCALVSSRWAAAAAAATRAPTFHTISRQLPWPKVAEQRDTRAASLQLWLAAHGQHITSLHASAAEPQLLLALPAMPALDLNVLPSTILQSLELQQLQVNLPTTGTTVSFQGFTQLTRLSLSSCYFPTAAVLTPPPALQELSLQGGLWGSCGSLLGTFLQSDALHGLTKLTLQDDITGFVLSTCLQHVKKLPCLGSLTLARPLSSSTQGEAAPGSHFSDLSNLQHLTELKISGIGVAEAGTVLAQLTNMQHLVLTQCFGLHAAALQGLSRLQHLHLDKVHIMTELLAALPGLQELTHLSLEGSMLDRAPAAAFTALTASSKLAHLRLAHAVPTQGSGDLWDYVFAPGQGLAQLTSLSVANCSPLPLQTLPDACPIMQQLELSLHEVYGGGAAAGSGSRQLDNGHGQLDAPPLAALQQLTGLTSLALRGGNFAPVSAGVRQLTGLRKLQVSAWYPLGSQDLLGLSNLPQ